MTYQPIFLAIAIGVLCGCSAPTVSISKSKDVTRVASLDYCADQFVLALVEPENIAALSPDATSSFSYLSQQAEGVTQVRSRTEDILLLRPDAVVRTYGGGPGITHALERAGIKVIQIGYAGNLGDVESVIEKTSVELKAPARGAELIAGMRARLSAVSSFLATETPEKKSALYLTSKGAIAGTGTVIDDLITHAGLVNHTQNAGWTTSIPLEQLVGDLPDFIATGFFETSDRVSDNWTPVRHPVAKRALKETQTINLPGSWTSCGAWHLVDAVEALAAGAYGFTPDTNND